MEYTATLSSSGQITLPKIIREKLNLKPGSKVNLLSTTDAVTIQRVQSLEEVLAEIDRDIPDDIRQSIQRQAGRTAAEYRGSWLSSPAARQYYHDQYHTPFRPTGGSHE